VPASGRCVITVIIAASRGVPRRSCEDGVVFDQFVDWVSGEWWSYLVIFAVSMVDAFFPLVPSETVVITGGVVASGGDLSLPLVIACAAGGAIAGDNISYFLGSWLGEHTVKRLFRHEKSRHAFEWAERQLETRGFYLIVVARFIPGGRTAVTFSSGYTHGMTWRRFIVADVVAGVVWASYAALLGYVGGKQFEEEPWKGLLLAFGIAVGVAVAIELFRHYRGRRATA
jgi:membrane protein DedA with SNARE-associated domain